MAAKTITYNGETTVLPEKPMTLGNGLKSMPVTATEQVVTDVETDERLPEVLETMKTATAKAQSTANDAMPKSAFSLSGTTLTITY